METRIGSFPVGIDVDDFNVWRSARCNRASFRKSLRALANRALVIGVDRLDYSKGLVQRMEAFERFMRCIPSGMPR